MIKFFVILSIVSCAVYCWRFTLDYDERYKIKFGLKEVLSSVAIAGIILWVISFLNSL